MASNELAAHALKIIDRVIKNLNINLTVQVYIMDGPKPEEDFIFYGHFNGSPACISNSTIQLKLHHYNILSRAQKLRRWNASVVILFLHEYSHYLIFKNLSISQRKEAIRKYSTYKYYEEKEEIEAWEMTIKLLKQLGYHTRKTIKQEIKKFDFPKGFKVRF